MHCVQVLREAAEEMFKRGGGKWNLLALAEEQEDTKTTTTTNTGTQVKVEVAEAAYRPSSREKGWIYIFD